MKYIKECEHNWVESVNNIVSNHNIFYCSKCLSIAKRYYLEDELVYDIEYAVDVIDSSHIDQQLKKHLDKS